MELILAQVDEVKIMKKTTLRPRYDTRVKGMAADGENGYFDYSKTLKRLDFYYKKVKCQILSYQSSTLGLFPTDLATSQEGHVRDSIYCAGAAWSLFLAYRRIDDDKGRTYELGQSAVKCMRGILRCWMKQTDKLEKFKNNQNPKNALHSRFHLITGDTVCSEEEYGHLQINVVSLYLIYLVEMISSGLQIIYSMDEINFIQNLVYYVERAYRTPDYGIWERGSKYNNGSCELHASSIGTAKAALEAINGFNLFGDQGASWSVIYVDIDAHNRNRTIFETLLPRESSSKNVDAALIPTISFPCFVTHDESLKKATMDKVVRKLKGKYGFKRFFRDGYKTHLEDASRKYYGTGEVKLFDGIECEWPIFFIYLIIDGIFRNDQDQVVQYQELLNKVLIYKDEEAYVPKYYYIPEESIELEKAQPGSQPRLPSGRKPNEIFLWGQSLYLICQLLVEGLLHINELDPIRRYLPAAERPRQSLRYSSFQGTCIDLGVQVVLIAESMRLQAMLATYGIQSQTPHQIEPIQIWSPNELIKVFEHLGVNDKLGLSGRPPRPVGTLGTGKVYRIMGTTVVCYPLLFEVKDFYLSYDMAMLTDDIRNDITFVAKCWKLRGRPTYCMLIREENMRVGNLSEILNLLAIFKRGSCDGIPIKIGRLQNLLSTSCIEHLDFYHMVPENEEICHPFQELTFKSTSYRSLTDIPNVTKINEEEFVDIMEEFQLKSTFAVISHLQSSPSLSEQCQLLHILLKREGLHFRIEDDTVERRLEKLIRQAGNMKNWVVVRFCSSLLGKLVDSLAPSITSVLVRGKQLTVGVFGFEEAIIDKPVTPNEVKTVIYRTCAAHDIHYSVLQQELIISIGKIIATAPHVFEGILKIRIGWIIHAMMLEMEYTGNGKSLNSLAPSDINKLLLKVLTINTETSDRTPLQRRCLDGALNRVPKNFYDRIWEILARTPGGLTVAGQNLPQQPTLSDMTMYEMNFSLSVENLLNKIVCPEYRQIIVELFTVVATILERNPELSFQGTVNTEQLVNEAFKMFQNDNLKEKNSDMSVFYNTAPSIQNGTTCYLAKAVLNHLLHSSILINNVEPCSTPITAKHITFFNQKLLQK